MSGSSEEFLEAGSPTITDEIVCHLLVIFDAAEGMITIAVMGGATET